MEEFEKELQKLLKEGQEKFRRLYSVNKFLIKWRGVLFLLGIIIASFFAYRIYVLEKIDTLSLIEEEKKEAESIECLFLHQLTSCYASKLENNNYSAKTIDGCIEKVEKDKRTYSGPWGSTSMQPPLNPLRCKWLVDYRNCLESQLKDGKERNCSIVTTELAFYWTLPIFQFIIKVWHLISLFIIIVASSITIYLTRSRKKYNR